jgi:hypothetical protein
MDVMIYSKSDMCYHSYMYKERRRERATKINIIILIWLNCQYVYGIWWRYWWATCYSIYIYIYIVLNVCIGGVIESDRSSDCCVVSLWQVLDTHGCNIRAVCSHSFSLSMWLYWELASFARLCVWVKCCVSSRAH